ncbi:MAG: hypothetical protein CMK32_03885 [Porticoccaceae bacterium]|nr:hypothetical protein [Porticoccaceae bacterium]
MKYQHLHNVNHETLSIALQIKAITESIDSIGRGETPEELRRAHLIEAARTLSIKLIENTNISLDLIGGAPSNETGLGVMNQAQPAEHHAESIISNRQAASKLAYAALERQEGEHFWAAFLSDRYELIDHKILLSERSRDASIYVREATKEALRLNAGAVIFAQKRRVGDATPSDADYLLNKKLDDAMRLVGIAVFDHFIFGTGEIETLCLSEED